MQIEVLELLMNGDGSSLDTGPLSRLRDRDVVSVAPLMLAGHGGPPRLLLVVGCRDGDPTTSTPPQKTTRVLDWRERLAEADRPCFDGLREWRRVAATRDAVAAFIVMPNRVLASLAATRPETLEELLQVPGIGELTATRYGDEVLAVLSEHQPEPAD